MRIPTPLSMWHYGDMMGYVADKKVEPDGSVWVLLKDTSPNNKTFWLPVDTLYGSKGMPVRTFDGKMRFWDPNTNKERQ